jgi:hypothetical protein
MNGFDIVRFLNSFNSVSKDNQMILNQWKIKIEKQKTLKRILVFAGIAIFAIIMFYINAKTGKNIYT